MAPHPVHATPPTRSNLIFSSTPSFLIRDPSPSLPAYQRIGFIWCTKPGVESLRSTFSVLADDEFYRQLRRERLAESYREWARDRYEFADHVQRQLRNMSIEENQRDWPPSPFPQRLQLTYPTDQPQRSYPTIRPGAGHRQSAPLLIRLAVDFRDVPSLKKSWRTSLLL